MSTDTSLLHEILAGLLAKGETIWVNLQTGENNVEKGTLKIIEHVPRMSISRGDFIGTRAGSVLTIHDLDSPDRSTAAFTDDEMDEHSRLAKIHGINHWSLTIARAKDL